MHTVAVLFKEGSINQALNFNTTHCAKPVVQTNLPSIVKTYIFRTGKKSTFTWTMPYKSISVLIIT